MQGRGCRGGLKAWALAATVARCARRRKFRKKLRCTRVPVYSNIHPYVCACEIKGYASVHRPYGERVAHARARPTQAPCSSIDCESRTLSSTAKCPEGRVDNASKGLEVASSREERVFWSLASARARTLNIARPSNGDNAACRGPLAPRADWRAGGYLPTPWCLVDSRLSFTDETALYCKNYDSGGEGERVRPPTREHVDGAKQSRGARTTCEGAGGLREGTWRPAGFAWLAFLGGGSCRTRAEALGVGAYAKGFSEEILCGCITCTYSVYTHCTVLAVHKVEWFSGYVGGTGTQALYEASITRLRRKFGAYITHVLSHGEAYEIPTGRVQNLSISYLELGHCSGKFVWQYDTQAHAGHCSCCSGCAVFDRRRSGVHEDVYVGQGRGGAIPLAQVGADAKHVSRFAVPRPVLASGWARATERAQRGVNPI
ncbi:hypothetical protein BU23DRAFT_269334 [Bimuria novae-zelandiae CBS 107.79]|uniref:Uncharacterized protein n=1 Tax=Bimuria novae-zelandiae CBS 107.79 TaxID=1447943 RepID=A0A6A5V434_9PLEO|nr:hypothetical protein BU23DRAFT_269334 [Bimuria novae-zelandiae CBS 107.79]